MVKSKSLNIYQFSFMIFLVVLIQFVAIIIAGLFLVRFTDTPKEYSEFDLEKTENRIAYDYGVQTFPITTGFLHDKKIGEMALVNMKEEECTQKVLTNFYFNYFKKLNLNYMLVLYSDKNFDYGSYITKNLVKTNVKVEKDNFGDYSFKDTKDTKVYFLEN